MTHDEALECVSNVGHWQPGKCETCGAPTMWRWTGLRMVADTGDERLAGKEIRHTAGDAIAQLLAAVEAVIEEYENLAPDVAGWGQVYERALLARDTARRISSSRRADSADDTTGSASACPSNANAADYETRRLAEEVGGQPECSAKRTIRNP